jgi:hypothetical protein
MPGKSGLGPLGALSLHPQSSSHALGIVLAPFALSEFLLLFPGCEHPLLQELQEPFPTELFPEPAFVPFEPQPPLQNNKSIHNQKQFILFMPLHMIIDLLLSYALQSLYCLYSYTFIAILPPAQALS